MLTAAVILVVALAIGLGVGHFLGKILKWCVSRNAIVKNAIVQNTINFSNL
jgi:hypothetical protein